MSDTLKGLMDEFKVRAECRDHGAPENPEFLGADGWMVTLFIHDDDGKRRMTVPFYMGYAHKGNEPEAENVLDCLLSDASSAEDDFDDWCGEMGFDSDSRRAERIYRVVVRQTERLRRFLGENFERFLYAERC